MELNELTAEQTLVRTAITQALVAAGWEATIVHEMAEEGQDVNYLASLEYGEGDVGLTIDYEPATETMHVTFGSAWGDNTVASMPADQRVQQALSIIVAAQDTLTEDSVEECTGQLRTVYPELTVEEAAGDG